MQIVGQLLRGNLDFFGRHPGAHGPQCFIAAAGVDVQTRAIENANDGRRGAGFHGVAGGKAIGIGEGQGLLRLCFKGLLVVDKRGGAELFLHGADLVFGKERKRFHSSLDFWALT